MLLPALLFAQKKTHYIPVTKTDSGRGLKKFKHIDTKTLKQWVKAQRKGEDFGLKTDGMDLWLIETALPDIKFSSGEKMTDSLKAYIVYEKGIMVGGLAIGKRISGGLVHNGKKMFFTNSKNDEDIIYSSEDEIDNRQFACEEIVPEQMRAELQESPSEITTGIPKAVGFHEECRYELTTFLGGKSLALSYMTGLLTMHKGMYGREGVYIYTRTLIIWDTPDPYTGTNQGYLLTSFANIVPTKGHPGDLAHLYGRTGGGGVAYVNGLVALQYFGAGIKAGMQCGYTGGIGAVVSGDINVYGWASHGSAHEKGHQLGNNHSHNCVWPIIVNGILYNMGRMDAWGQKAGYEKTDVCVVQLDSLTTNIDSMSWMGYMHLFGLRPIRLGRQPTQRSKDRIFEFRAYLQDSGYGSVPPISTCIPRKEIRNLTCPPGQKGEWVQQRDSSCTTGLGDWYNTTFTCQDTVPKSCIYKIGDTTYYQIKDTLKASTLRKFNALGQWVPSNVQVVFTCTCTEYSYKWEKIRGGVTSTIIASPTAKTIYYTANGVVNYQPGDVVQCTVTSKVRTKSKTCVNAKPAQIVIK